MNMSEEGIKLLHEREGRRTKAYRDSQGYWTIGLGHLLSTDKNADFSHVVWTQEQVEEAWLQDKARFEKAVNDGLKVSVPQHAFDALVSFTYNIGTGIAGKPATGGFLNSTMLRMINAGNMVEAGKQFDRWHIPAEITSRRNGEKHQFIGDRFEARINEYEHGPVA
jgi:lysozyme